MSKLTKKVFHAPLNSKAINVVTSFLNKGKSEQVTPATVTVANGHMDGMRPVTQDCDITSLYFMSAIAAGAGESMVIDVQVKRASGGGFASILSGTFTYDTEAGATQIELSGLINAGAAHLFAGDVVAVGRTYTAGAGAMLDNCVILEAAVSANA